MEEVKNEGIYDASSLGKGKMLVLGFQHMFAMFGATVLVPLITGLPVSATLLFAGIGTLIFHLCTKRMVPAFLGSSFAFLGGYAAVVEMGAALGYSTPVALTYACIGVACAGIMYFILSALFYFYGVRKTMRFFPPVVTGPIIISIGLILSASAINNCQACWWVAILAIAIIVVANVFGKGMIKIIPILLGVLGSYLVAACAGKVDFTPMKEAAWFGLPVAMENTAFAALKNPDWSFVWTAIIAIVPISFATMIEHIGDICAITSTCQRNYLETPGLHRTLLGDGLATMVAAMFGAPANTTYGENTGVLNLTKVFDPKVVRIAAVLAILFSFSPKFAQLIYCMPTATVGGVSLVLYGMISAVGVRNLVENKVNFQNNRNVLVAALILVLAIGIQYGPGSVAIGKVSLSGLAIAAIAGIILNAVLPGKDFQLDTQYTSGKTAGPNTEGFTEEMKQYKRHQD